jgi:hypothetical protein
MACDFLDRGLCHVADHVGVVIERSAKARAELEERVGFRSILDRLRMRIVLCFLQKICQWDKLNKERRTLPVQQCRIAACTLDPVPQKVEAGQSLGMRQTVSSD